jgi:hypothetical protein
LPSAATRPMMGDMGTNGGLFGGTWTDLTGWLRGKPKEEERRAAGRLPVHDQAQLSWRLESGLQQSATANLIDVSDIGFKVRCSEEIPVGTSIRLTDSNDQSATGTIVHVEADEDAYLVGAKAQWEADEQQLDDSAAEPAA